MIKQAIHQLSNKQDLTTEQAIVSTHPTLFVSDKCIR